VDDGPARRPVSVVVPAHDEAEVDDGPARRPVSVVVPAHDEAEVVGRLLDGLAPGMTDGWLEVVVVANGCTDDTAAEARARGATVVELAVGHKPSALRAGDEAASWFPRFYVDADVELDAEGVARLAEALAAGAPAVAPALELDTTGASWAVRSYHRIWSRLDSVQRSLAGRGCFGVDEVGRSRWDEFPDVTADDQFVNQRFSPAERHVVDTVRSTVRIPLDVRSLVARKRRSHRGNRELAGATGRAVTSSTSWLDVVRADPRRLADVPVYVAVTAAVRFGAVLDERRGAAGWGADRSSRRGGAVAAGPGGGVPGTGGPPQATGGLAATGAVTADPDPDPDPDRPRASVVIVAYRSADHLPTCLGSLAAATTVAHEVIVVDNASPDDTAVVVAERFPDVTLVPSPVNLGFAGGVNLGASRARGDLVVLLNPDTEVRSGAVDALVAAHDRLGPPVLLGGRTLTPAGDLDPRSAWGLPTAWSLVCFATGLSTLFAGRRLSDPESLGRWARDDEREVGAVSGGFLAVDRATWQRLGGLDEAYFMYGEDLDLAIRARALGVVPRIVPDAEIVHEVGASSSSGDKRVMVMRGKATILRRHRGRWGARAGVAALVVGTGLRAGLTGVGRRVVGRPRDDSWVQAWRRRSEWRVGWS
jgi:N-acetylglucosaminyl-diphospho-decaprenol L-rhamnosyltransferase